MTHEEILKTCAWCGAEFRTTQALGRRTKCNDCLMATYQVREQSGKQLLGKPLNTRERQIELLISQAKTTKEIAHELHLAVGTIKVYTTYVLAKLGVKSREEVMFKWWSGKLEEVLQANGGKINEMLRANAD
jgi:DNA-binding NarL/FixJ family response regulator